MLKAAMFTTVAFATLAVAPCYADDGIIILNGLALNSLAANSLAANGLSQNAVAMNALTSLSPNAPASTATSKQATIGQLGQVIAVELPRR